MYRFGFELEGFYVNRDKSEVELPPKNYPTDGFPGLCEVRTEGGQTLDKAYFELQRLFSLTPFNASLFEHTFTPAQKRVLRQRNTNKEAIQISNIYGKEPKALGNRTLASLQLNFSLQTRSEFYDDKGHKHNAVYGLFDFRPIIEALDKEFEKEIKYAKRQPGFYAVKDGVRVEYRSLPNCVVNNFDRPRDFIERIERAFK